jgi:uncharacterized coiled-coil DUF342 family protein
MIDQKTQLKILSLERQRDEWKKKYQTLQARCSLDEQRLLQQIVNLQERLEDALAMNEYYRKRLENPVAIVEVAQILPPVDN